jgi:class 3 adenylate cyclase/predicted ATPase
VDIAAWLHGLGLQQYEPAFRDNAIDAAVLPELTADDLKDLGVNLVGHRRRLLAAIAVLRSDLDAAPKSAVVTPSAERRQLTVMFCDLVGSTALASRLDPEDLREVIGAYHKCVAETIGSFDGFVAKYMGDGVLAYFGYPQAHEDDAERAVRAGLGLVDAVGRLDVKFAHLQARVGVATGLVVVGDLIGEGSAQEQAVVGGTANLAARLQTLAEPDTVVIAANTRRLLGDLFEYQDLGAVEVKGIPGSVPAWRALRPSAVASRFEALHGAALAPLVGRNEEIDLLLRRWARAKAGDGQVVLISGEPGIGKSRLVAELVQRLEPEPHIRLRYFCSPYYQDSALHPLIDQLGRAAGFVRDDPSAVRLEKLEALLAQAEPPDEDVALLIDLLSLPESERHPLPGLSPQRKKDRTLGALIRQLEGLARRQPVIVILEDAHWIDPTSRELFDLTIERIPDWPVLFIATFRPEFQPFRTGLSHVTMMVLARLGRRDTAMMVAKITGVASLPGEIVQEIAERTDGVPLFVEELTKAVLESGLQAPDALSIAPHAASPVPATLHASLLARLDRLGPEAKDIAQRSSIIGRKFGYELLASIADLPESQLLEALQHLTKSGLLFVSGTPPHSSYMFNHSLVQDVAYDTLLRGRRLELHRKTAEALSASFPEIAQGQPEVLAYHFTQAGLVDRAIEFWYRAGLRAFKVSANKETIAHTVKGLELVGTVPRSPECARHEFRLCILLGQASVAMHGFGAQETIGAYSRASLIAEELGDVSLRLAALSGLWAAYYTRALPEQRETAGELLKLVEQHPTPARLCIAHRYVGGSSLVYGELTAARDHLERAMTFYDPNELQFAKLSSASMDIGVAALAELAFPVWLLGYPDQAWGQADKARSLALRIGHEFTIAYALAHSAKLGALDGRTEPAREDASRLLSVARSQGFPLYSASGRVLSGWASTLAGDAAGGIEHIRQGLADWANTGAEMWLPMYLYLLAKSYRVAGEVSNGLATVDKAMAAVKRTEERWIEAELHRLYGDLLGAIGDRSGAERNYHQALTVAERQDARLWQLRAATSLARLWDDQGKCEAASDLLAPIYAWFTEGFETPDLIEAKTLLAELGSGTNRGHC